MGTRTETREISYCDVCGREDNTYNECIVCGKEFCLTCKATIPGSILQSIPYTCKECGERDDVRAIFKEWAPRLEKIRKARDTVLEMLPETPPTTDDEEGDDQP